MFFFFFSSENELMVGGRMREGIDGEFGMDTLLYLRWITKKALLHRGLCSRLCGSLDGGGVWRRMDTCTCMAESLHCSPDTIVNT